MAALDYRRRTGRGLYIDIAQYENAIHFLAPVILDYTVNHRIQGRVGNRCLYAAPHGPYRCKGDDKWCVITIFTDAEWLAFCEVIGNPEWTNQIKFSTLAGRKENEDELNQRIEEWTINHTAEEVTSKLQQAGVPAAPVRNVEDIVENCPQLKYRHYFWTLNHPEIGKHKYYRSGYILSETPAELNMPAPCLGEHTEYVCKELLGMSEDEYVDLLINDAFE